MRNRLYDYIKKLLLPCIALSMLTGFLSAIFITAFKLAAEAVIRFSTQIYATARSTTSLFPVLVLGAAAIGLAASFILSHSRSCRGGGIPTSVAAIRGIVSFRWFAGIFILPFSALLTFLCGLPLGTEGPCVQMGTAVGDGVVKCFSSKKQKGWRRYVMTGGASAGFSIATSSPITAIIFSMEELHKHFSPMLLTVASVSVVTAQITTHLLASLGIGSVSLFHIPDIDPVAPKFFFAALIVGIICGICAILFTYLYRSVDKMMHSLLKKLSVKIVFPILFACVAIVGFFFSDALRTGHSLTERLFQRQAVWYILIIVFLIRAIFMTVSNTVGATGGIFLPTIAFGAIIGALLADGMIALGWIGTEHYLIMVILGITAFLGSTSRIPITACVFALEALGGINNLLPIIIATTVALIIVEASGLEDFTDTVIDAKVRSISKGKTPTVVEVSLVVKPDSFVVGKELRDVLWPNSCSVVSFDQVQKHHSMGIAEGDVITVHYKTYNPEATAEALRTLVGEQSDEVNRLMSSGS